MTESIRTYQVLVADMARAQHKQERELVRLRAELERATRLIRKWCDEALESPGCIWPECDCGVRSPDGEPV